MRTGLEVSLGQWGELADLFAYDADAGAGLTDWLAEGFNQTLDRDNFDGAWADVDEVGGEVSMKLTTPAGDLSAYGTVIPAFLAACRVALAIYRKNQPAIQRELIYYPPVGMSMARTQSVQLLHYPPYEARTFFNYLYSPTNSRCESLWNYNGFDRSQNTLLERIVDVVPLAGPGGDATYINRYVEKFMPYAKAMLGAVLDGSGKATQPVVAYGGPVHDWVVKAFPTQVHKKLNTLDLVTVTVGKNKATTPILCANHPSLFLYYTKPNSDPKQAFQIMYQDLVAFRWQAQMSQGWGASPTKALSEAKAYWSKRTAEVKQIVKAQTAEFGYGR